MGMTCDNVDPSSGKVIRTKPGPTPNSMPVVDDHQADRLTNVSGKWLCPRCSLTLGRITVTVAGTAVDPADYATGAYRTR